MTPLWKPFETESNRITIKMPHTIAKPVNAVLNLFARIESHISDQNSRMNN